MSGLVPLAAQTLLAARRSGETIDDLPLECRPQNAAEGYAIQDEVGKAMTPVLGWKVSRPGGSTIVTGALYDETFVRGGTLSVTGVIQPLVEVESAFRVREPIKPSDSDETLLSKVDFVPLFEIVHSRYKDIFKVSRFSLLADNMAAGFIKVGAPVARWRDWPADQLQLRITAAGTLIEEFNFAEKLKAGIALVLAILRNEDARTRIFAPGTVITTGSMNKPATLSGEIAADYGPLGANTLIIR
jgi:2-oxo-hept-3-ene-1,7-dioate hydratase